ncbi:1115_t:CDS:2 [Paraglomus occultum]|uniref:1115_t:CDS:1 n=1 Tax=Paraglomus occultum TaxID=144539 RepID=A0A9N8ZEM1_9GLOM|nr:1115_t:CDS:2 [Paraglomus occultum]
MNRAAAHAGTWYSDQESRLNKELSKWLGKVPETTEDNIPYPVQGARAIIAPHAGYLHSGPAAAFAYKCIDPQVVKRVFILGPSHHVYLPGCALSKCTEYETPLGNLTLDLDVINELGSTGHFTDMSLDDDEAEHSIEMHLPYTYKILESKIDSIKIVPILVGALSTSKEVLYGKLLAPYLENPENLFIISSDFCHWGQRFSYTYYSPSPDKIVNLSYKSTTPLTVPIHESIEKLDKEGMAIIERISHRQFTEYLGRTKNTICGRHPISVLLCALEVLTAGIENGFERPRIRFVHYAQSGKVVNERDSSVSYASAYVYIPDTNGKS